MRGDKQIDVIYEDLVEIFDEEYNRRNLITPQNTAERMTAKGYRKTSDIAREIFEEIESVLLDKDSPLTVWCAINGQKYAELKKKYTESEKDNGKM